MQASAKHVVIAERESTRPASGLRGAAGLGNKNRVHTDSESGSKSDRPQFQAMFKAASQRKFDVLLFWSLDQLSREGVLETLQHLNRLTSHGVNYRSFTEQYFDSCGIFKDARPESTKNQRGKYRWSTKPNVPLRRTREFEKWSQEDSWTRTLKPRCHSHVENILAGIPVADLRSG